ncbi:uncharacterized protein LODBEIA_P52610 [Lodderomyces beijingensis]|uniref:WD40 repeat-like protein n=1 Tax=Lodderomyces beijingensis TaxID=1775926 RepID=A0ABP0ZSF5_9ASCO
MMTVSSSKVVDHHHYDGLQGQQQRERGRYRRPESITTALLSDKSASPSSLSPPSPPTQQPQQQPQQQSQQNILKGSKVPSHHSHSHSHGHTDTHRQHPFPSAKFDSLNKIPNILCVNFNQDHGCFAISHENGFLVYNSNPLDLRVKRHFNTTTTATSAAAASSSSNLHQHHQHHHHVSSVDGSVKHASGSPSLQGEPQKLGQTNSNNYTHVGSGIGHITMLHRTNYLALIGGGNQPKFPNNKLIIWDDLKRKISLSVEFDKPIINVLLSRTRIVVVLVNEVAIYAFTSPPKKLATFETCNNESGVASLSSTGISNNKLATTSSSTTTTAASSSTITPTSSSSVTSINIPNTQKPQDQYMPSMQQRGSYGSTTSNKSNNSQSSNYSVGDNSAAARPMKYSSKKSQNGAILACPGKAIGQIQIIDLGNEQETSKNGAGAGAGAGGPSGGTGAGSGGGSNISSSSSIRIVKAHKSAIYNICLNKSGTLIASASISGTIIRIHSTKTTNLLYEFRRGIDRAVITSMKFNHNDTRLAVLSDKYTLHVFDVENLNQENHSSNSNSSNNSNYYNYHNNTGEADVHTNHNKEHILNKYMSYLPMQFLPQYFKSTWSFCSVNTSKYHPNETVLDKGILGWSDNDTIIIIWPKKKIWEKYLISRQSSRGSSSSSNNSSNNNNNNNNNNSNNHNHNHAEAENEDYEWDISRISWKSLEQNKH